MKIVFKRLLIILVTLVLIASSVAYLGRIARPRAYDFDVWSKYYAETDDSIDVLMLGSSAMYRYWIPPQAYKEYGFTSFLLTHASQDTRAVPYILEEALKYQKPKVVVVEVRQLPFEQYSKISGDFDQPWSSYQFSRITAGMRPSLARTKMIHNLLVEDEENSEIEWQIPLLKYHDNLFTHPPKSLIKRLWNKKDPLKSTRQEAMVKKLKTDYKTQDSDYSITQEDKDCIDTIYETAKKHDTEVMFVATPYVGYGILRNIQDSLDKYMEEKNYPFFNMVDKESEIGLDTNVDFYNERHTNVSGARKLTSYFGRYLKDNYRYDSNSEKVKKDWESAVKNWEEEESELLVEWQQNVDEIMKKSAK